MRTLRLVCLSDTHNRHKKIEVPPGDVLIHAGDFTGRGEPGEIAAFNKWLGALPHRHKVVIAGNHDFLFERDPARAQALLTGCVYLQDQAVEIEGLRIYGSPWQPWFYDWAFNLQRGPEIAAKWALIPAGPDSAQRSEAPFIDVLVTHGPPLGHGDRTDRGELVGCADLLEAIRRVRPRYHVFGHIHEGYGVTEEGGTRFLNASNCDADYHPVNPPLVVEVEVP